MNRIPSPRQLQHLLTLHAHHHFGEAARACFVSQSTLSASISNLETLLGGALLERQHKSFVFTPLGEEVVRRARPLLEGLSELADFVRTSSLPMHGTLHVGCIPTIAPFILRTLLKECRREFPNLQLRLREDTTDHLLEQLTQGTLDVVILALPWPTAGLTTRVLCRDPFYLVCPEQQAARLQADMDIARWPAHSIFLLEREHCLTAHALEACALRDTRQINPFFATSLHTLTSLVESEQGVTFLPELAITGGILEGTHLTALAPATPDAYREIGIAWRQSTGRVSDFEQFSGLTAKILKRLVRTPN